MGISYSFEEKDTQKLYGSHAVDNSCDFSTKGALKKYIKEYFKNYTCPSCGGHQVDGEKIIVEIGKVKLFKEVKKGGFFGKSKFKNEHFKDSYRVYNIQIESSGFLKFAGYLRCKSCGWEQKGEKGVRWLSVNDIMNGRL